MQGVVFLLSVEFFCGSFTLELDELEDVLYEQILPDIFGDAQQEFSSGTPAWIFIFLNTILGFVGFFEGAVGGSAGTIFLNLVVFLCLSVIF